jgi:hypothetical protein
LKIHKYVIKSSTYATITLKATLNKGPKNRVQWNQTFLLVNTFKVVPMALDEALGPRQIKLWFSLHGIILEGKPIGPNKKEAYKRVHGLENQGVS